MSDRDPNAPADPDPFAQLDVGGKQSDDPFAELGEIGPGESSNVGAFTRGAVRSALPSAAGMVTGGAGAEVGAAVGAFGGPFAPVTVPVGALVGFGVGAYLGSKYAGQAQDYALKKLPDSWQEALGQDDRQQRIDEGEHPTAAFLGGLAPFVVQMRPGAIPTKTLPPNATALERILSHPATKRVFGGVAMGGMELGNEAIEGQSPDWGHVAIATGMGVVFNKPTRFGEALTEAGAAPVRSVVPWRVTAPTHGATVAQAGDTKVMGPGITEDVFKGSHEQEPSAAMATQEAARTEKSLIEGGPEPDVGHLARRLEADIFARHEELLARRNTFAHWVQELEANGESGGDLDHARTQLAAVENELGKIEPDVAAAYRRAADAAGQQPPQETVAGAEPVAAATATPARSLDEQRAAIAADVTRKFQEAGRPPQEAQALGALQAERFITRAARFNGALGTAEELYAREGPIVRGPRGSGGGSPLVPAGERVSFKSAGATRKSFGERMDAYGPLGSEGSVVAEAPAKPSSLEDFAAQEARSGAASHVADLQVKADEWLDRMSTAITAGDTKAAIGPLKLIGQELDAITRADPGARAAQSASQIVQRLRGAFEVGDPKAMENAASDAAALREALQSIGKAPPEARGIETVDDLRSALSEIRSDREGFEKLPEKPDDFGDDADAIGRFSEQADLLTRTAYQADFLKSTAPKEDQRPLKAALKELRGHLKSAETTARGYRDRLGEWERELDYVRGVLKLDDPQGEIAVLSRADQLASDLATAKALRESLDFHIKELKDLQPRVTNAKAMALFFQGAKLDQLRGEVESARDAARNERNEMFAFLERNGLSRSAVENEITENLTPDQMQLYLRMQDRVSAAMEKATKLDAALFKAERNEAGRGPLALARVRNYWGGRPLQHQWHLFEPGDNPAMLGSILLNARDPVHLWVDFIGGKLSYDTIADTFGARAMREILRQIKEAYPYAETIGGHRVTGARNNIKAALLHNEPVPPPKKLSPIGEEIQGITDAMNAADEANDPQRWRELREQRDRLFGTLESPDEMYVLDLPALDEYYQKLQRYEEAQKSFKGNKPEIQIRPSGYAEKDLRAKIANSASPDEINKHPVVRQAMAAEARVRKTSSFAGYGSEKFRAERVFDFNGERVRGYDNAVSRLTDQAKAYAGGEVAKDRKALFIIGLPGSGKSTLAEAMARARNAAIPDPDDAKQVIPQYRGGRGNQAVKDEANALVLGEGGVGPRLIEEGANVVIPTSGRDYASLKAISEALGKHGYSVDLVHVDLDKDEAYRRNVSRWLDRGDKPRAIVPKKIIDETALNAPQNFLKLQEEGLIHEAAKVDGRAPRSDVSVIEGQDTGLGRELAGEAVREKLRGSMGGGPHDVRGGAEQEEGQGVRELFQTKESTPIFFSAVSRAVDSIKQTKASPEQWLGTLKNLPGVKDEEMEWLGLKDWLREQKGSVTKEQVQDYIRANQIEVKEVEKGKSSGPRPTLQQRDAVLEWGDTASNHARDEATHTIEDFELNRISPRQAAQQLEALGVPDNLLEPFRNYAGGESGPKFASYQLPGGENYRELLLTLPPGKGVRQAFSVQHPIDPNGTVSQREWRIVDERGQWIESRYTQDEANARARELGDLSDKHSDQDFRSSHWDEPNVLAHIRFNDRVIDGKKTLFIEEVQSDWHQKGKKHGYQGEGLKPEVFRVVDKDLNTVAEFASKEEAMAFGGRHFAPGVRWDVRGDGEARMHRVPDAPFKTTWPELSLKRMIRYAAESGYDKLAWTPGEVQAERYDLSKQISELHYQKNPDGTYRLGAYDKNSVNGHHRHHEFGDAIPADKLEDYVGKDVAKRILDGHGEEINRGITVEDKWKRLSGLDLKVGGEGMLGFYDDILPAAANKLVKKFGGRVTQETLAEVPPQIKSGNGWESTGSILPSPARAVHSLSITPDLRKAAVEQGFPLFQPKRGSIRLREGTPSVISLFQHANASTAIHELGHDWLEQFIRDARHEQAPEDLKADLKTAMDWLGVASPEEIARRHHEKWATGIEQYLRLGIAPSEGLARVFAQFKQWLTQIYQTIRGLGTEISPEIRDVFDRLLSPNPRRAVFTGDLAEGPPSLQSLHEIDAATTHPAEAHGAADRIASEAERYLLERHPEVQHEIQAAETKLAEEAEREGGEEPTNGGSGAEPATEVRGSPGESGSLDRGAAEPGAVGRGSGGGAQHAAVSPRGNESAGESAGLQPRERPAQDRAGAPLAPSAGHVFGPETSQYLDKAGNIRLDTLTSDQDVRGAIKASAAENADFIGDRRGVVTDGQVMELADALGMSFDKLSARKVGQAFNAEEVMAARKLLIESATNLSHLMKMASTGTDEDVLAYAEAKARHQVIQGHVAGITAEAGRALRAFRDISGGMTGEAANADAIARQATGKTLFQLREEAKLGSSLETPQQVSKFMQDAQKRTFGRMVLEYWINGLISGPATHITYMVGNTILALEKMAPETAAAAMIGRLRSSFGREGPTVRLGEVAAQFGGIGRGLAPALKASLDALSTGVTTALPGEKPNVFTTMPLQPGAELATPNTYMEAARFHDVAASAFGIVRGLRDGIVAAGGLITSGGVEGAPLVGAQYSHLGSIPDIQMRGVTVAPIGSAIRLPGRFIAAIHSFFRAMNYSMDKNAQAYRKAMDEGLSGTDFDARVADLRQNPTEEMMAASVSEATELTLMGQGGEFTRALSRLTNAEVFGFPMLKFIDPFVKISSAIIEQSLIERTPIGLLSPEIRADLAGENGNIAADKAAAKMLMGTALGITFGALAAEGYVSGSGPSDPHEAAMWRLAGNQAHSVKIGDIWYDMHRLGPMGMLLSTAADLYDIAHLAATDDVTKAAAHLQHAITQNILDESFMRGPADLIKAVEDPGRYGEAYVRNFASSFVPYSVGLAQMARASDPYSRQARTVLDAIKAKVPGLSQQLLPRRDIWGEPMPNKEALLAKGLTAIWEQQVSHDPVNLAMLDLGVHPANVERKIRNVELSEAQYDDFSRLAGRMTKMRLDVIVKSPDWQTWPNHIRHDVIQEVLRQSRETARGIMLMKYPEIVQKATAAKLKRLQD